MIVLLRAWCNSSGTETAEWAVVSLVAEAVELCLLRIDLAKQIAKNSSYHFYGVQYWSDWPVWIGYCEQWNEEYKSEAQFLDKALIAGEHKDIAVEYALMLVTTEGVEWGATIKNTSTTTQTAILTVEQLEQIQERMLHE